MRPLNEKKRLQAERVAILAKAMDVEILAHFYQRAEVKALADYVGGSRGLYGRVQASTAGRVMICGVSFMLGAMERLRPDLEILVPRKDAGCPFSDPVGAEQVARIRASEPNPVVVADIQASAEVRDLADVVLSSEPWVPPEGAQGRIHVLPALSSGDPDRIAHLDHPGALCQVHRQVGAEAVMEARERRSPVLVAVNSLCSPEIRAMADFAGDSQSIFDWCASKPGERFLVVAESGLAESLSEAFPESRFFETETEIFCPNMKLVNIKDVLAALEAAWRPGLAACGGAVSVGAGD